jgi:hypothetical protein
MSVHRDHAVRFNLGVGWLCEACPFVSDDTAEGRYTAIGHAIAHQYKVAPPKAPVDITVRHRR